MKKSTFKHMLILSFALFCFGVNAQSNAFWTKASAKQTQNRPLAERNAMPQEYNLFALNTSGLKNILANAPQRNAGISNVIIDLPTNKGELQKFRVFEASVMEPAFQAQHPNLRSYAAQGIDDPSAIARFSVTDRRVNVMITSANYSTIYIDPFTKDSDFYIAYNLDQINAIPNSFQCHVEDTDVANRPEGTESVQNANDGTLRIFRLALASTGEYSSYHWNAAGVSSSAPDAEKKDAVLAAMVVTMTRVNGVYERDVALTMVLVDNMDIIYLNSSTDPYTNNNGFTMLAENQAVCDSEIGSANYDIGHVFSTGGGGIAGLRVPCVAGSKARGVTGLTSPVGDNYDIDFVAHEMGHQFGANHTFNNSCGNNRNFSTAMEPGSGSTIMAYAGICPPNIQSHSDAHFHAISILEIWSNIKNGNSSSCPEEAPTNNLPPTADAGENYTIPNGTPFVLTGTATDPDGDALSHSWEQMDNQIAPMSPRPNSTEGPAFRSVAPLPVPERYMPDLSYVLGGHLGGPSSPNRWEVLPEVGRTMRFRYTVRDNAVLGGSSDSDNMIVIFDDNDEPFMVTSQDEATTWNTRSTEYVSWNVAGSDVAPVNSPNVDIMFSTDGGLTYPITIAQNIPNNGGAVINVPNINTTTGRMMIKSSNNIFYALNDATISIQGTVGVEEFAFDNFTIYPNPSNGSFNLTFTPASNDRIEVSLFDLRGRAINKVTFDDVSASSTFTKQLDYNYVETGMYFLVVKNGDKVTTKKVIKN